MEKKATRRWQLQDLLHSVGEPGISKSEYDNPDVEEALQARTEPRNPELLGDKTILDLEEQTGLPEWLNPTEEMHILQAIRKDMRGHTPTLQWTVPITCATQLKTSLEDKQLPLEDDRRYRNVILRAQPKFQGVPAFDKVKVWIEEDNGRKLYFAKYVITFIIIPEMFIITNVLTFIVYILQVLRLLQGRHWPTLRRTAMVRESCITSRRRTGGDMSRASERGQTFKLQHPACRMYS
jgi:hypothetical protein